MHVALSLLVPLAIASAVTATPPSDQRDRIIADQPQATIKNCRGKIETVREERGLPKLRRENAQRGDAMMILAVDKTIDGCEVLVMANDTRDVRPLPEFRDGPARLQH